MKILLDTHILLWFFQDDKRLSTEARAMIEDEANEIYYSILSVWEVAIKNAAHPDKLSLSGENFLSYCEEVDFNRLELNVKHILGLKNLKRKEGKPPHKDPFDNLMLAQAVAEEMTFITHDEHIAEYDCENIFKV